MTRKLTGQQHLALLQSYAAQSEGGWIPDGFENLGEVRVARRLAQSGLLIVQADAAETFIPTAAGREALGIDTVKPPKRVRDAVRRALAWRGFPPEAWEILTGRQLPVIQLDEGEANYRECRFALREVGNEYGDVAGFLRALANWDPELQWQALAQYMTDLGFPVYYEGPDFAGVIGFWPRED
jgi:hypothetical protein